MSDLAKNPVSEPVLDETGEKQFEELPQETQERIMALCDKAGMPCDWMETLRNILKDLNKPELPDKSNGNRAVILQGVRGEIGDL